MNKNDKFQLNNGLYIPKIGFGVWQNVDYKECVDSVYLAIKNGFRLIDTADIYTNEEAVGEAIKKAISEGIVNRQELFITTKLWIDQFEDAYESIQLALKKLQVEYIDLMLLHQPYGNIFNAWKGLEKAYKEGLIKAIGISNFKPDVYENLSFFAEIKPMVNQIEVNPFHQRYDDVNYFQENNVQIQAWSPLATGKNNIFNNETLLKIAKKHKTTIPVIVSKWLIQRNIIPLVKSTNEDHIKEFSYVNSFELDNQDIEDIKSLNQNASVYFDHRDPETVKYILSRKTR